MNRLHATEQGQFNGKERRRRTDLPPRVAFPGVDGKVTSVRSVGYRLAEAPFARFAAAFSPLPKRGKANAKGAPQSDMTWSRTERSLDRSWFELTSDSVLPATFPAPRGFTLIELLIVMVIIGILAAIGLPAMKGIGQANMTAAANRQILDDLAYARLRAINDRSKVYMVFVPPTFFQRMDQAANNALELRSLTNLISGQYIAYALIAERTVGDQPGRATPRYLTDWKNLPDGLLFAPYKFNPASRNHPNEYLRTFATNSFPFPNSRSALFPLPYIGFNSQGQLLVGRDELIALARGSIFNPRDNRGFLLRTVPDVQLIPPGANTNHFQFVRVNWLTGRAKMELPELK